jgi:glycosidase
MRRYSLPDWRRPAAALALLALASLWSLFLEGVDGAEGPAVIKVEPPNWWAGHSINPVRLLVRGHRLQGSRVLAKRKATRVRGMRTNEAGTYLFIDLEIDRRAAPGPAPLTLTTSEGTTEIPFEISQPLPREGNFQGFGLDDVIYLLMPDRFANGDPSNDHPAASPGLLDRSRKRYYHGGDLQGVIDKLPYLKELGVTAIWLNPVYDNNNRLNEREVYDGEPITDYHGYGAVDFYAVDEHLGDLAKFRELVQVAHRLNLKVIQDQVANHTGPYHPWVKDQPTPTWFNGTEAAHIANNWQTRLLMDPSATSELRRPVLDGWFINILPDLNQDDPEVARYLIQNTLWWIGMTGLDAIRQDTLPYVPRRFWAQWMAAIKRQYPRVNVVGETLDGSPALVAFMQGGAKRFDGVDSGIDTEFDYPLFFALRRAFGEGQSIRQVCAVLNEDYLYPNAAHLVTLLGSHDVPRFMNERGATREGLKLAFTFLATVRGIPQLYYGDEIGLPGGGDPDNRYDFPGGWPNDPRDAFTTAGRTAPEREVYEHARRVLALRKELEPLRRGRQFHLAIGDQTYVFARATDRKTIIVAFNNGTAPETVEFVLPRELKLGDGRALRDRLGPSQARVAGGRLKLSIAPRSAGVYE